MTHSLFSQSFPILFSFSHFSFPCIKKLVFPSFFHCLGCTVFLPDIFYERFFFLISSLFLVHFLSIFSHMFVFSFSFSFQFHSGKFFFSVFSTLLLFSCWYLSCSLISGSFLYFFIDYWWLSSHSSCLSFSFLLLANISILIVRWTLPSTDPFIGPSGHPSALPSIHPFI